MGTLFMESLNSDWELSVVENAGEIPAASVTDTVAVSTAPLLTDIKAQLMLVPKTLTYTVGWRALVWKKKDSGQFQDLTDEEYQQYISGGVVTYTRGAGKIIESNEDATGVKKSTTD